MIDKKFSVSAFLLITAVTAGFVINAQHASPVSYEGKMQTYDFLSPPYHIDNIYKSMLGPKSNTKIVLGKGQPPELYWITGYNAVMVGEDGKTKMPQEFMCHSNLDFNLKKRRKKYEHVSNVRKRIFTLSQGQYSLEFPPGFGIPIMSDEPVDLETQVLNLNIKNPDAYVRHKVAIEYVRDRDFKGKMRPLFSAGAFSAVLIEGDNPYFNEDNPNPSFHGPGCALGEHAVDSKDRGVYTDNGGNTFSGHWIVPPGRHVYKSLATNMMSLAYDTKLHYILVHLHPFAESIELKDLTTGKVIFKGHAENFNDKIGLANVESFSDGKGIPVFRDHEYEVTTVYNNTSGENQDAMAVLILFLHDKEFKISKKAL